MELLRLQEPRNSRWDVCCVIILSKLEIHKFIAKSSWKMLVYPRSLKQLDEIMAQHQADQAEFEARQQAERAANDVRNDKFQAEFEEHRMRVLSTLGRLRDRRQVEGWMETKGFDIDDLLLSHLDKARSWMVEMKRVRFDPPPHYRVEIFLQDDYDEVRDQIDVWMDKVGLPIEIVFDLFGGPLGPLEKAFHRVGFSKHAILEE